MSQPFGAYYQCYKNPYATYKCLESFRNIYPKNTIILISDNGYDYTEMAKQFDCIYIHETNKARLEIKNDIISIETLKENFQNWSNRIIKSCLLCDEEYIMWLEDDVRVNSKIMDTFQYDLNGFCPNVFLKGQIEKYSVDFPILNNDTIYKFSGHGGSVFKKNKLIECFNNNSVTDILFDNWKNYGIHEFAHDFVLSLLIHINKGTVGSYEGHYDSTQEIVNVDHLRIQHQFKRYYGVPLPTDKLHLVDESPDAQTRPATKSPTELVVKRLSAHCQRAGDDRKDVGISDLISLGEVGTETSNPCIMKPEFVNIIDKTIDLNVLNDGRTENTPIQIGYSNIDFVYLNKEYNNDVQIPKIIHFIWIGKIIPQKYVNTVIKCKEINESYQVILWVDDSSINVELTVLLTTSRIEVRNIYYDINDGTMDIQSQVINNINSFENYGFKADIIRLYCVYRYGGIYSDIDTIWIKPLDVNFNYEFVTYRIDQQCSNITNSFFGFNKESHIVQNAINNLSLSISCFLKINNPYIFKIHIPVISGPGHLTRIIKEMYVSKLNYIHQGYCVCGGPHEEIYSNFYTENQCYCYQTFDKNWC